MSILVNNAGWGLPCPLDETDYQELEGIINLNIGPYVYLTRSLLPRMLKREKRSGIIFNASFAAEVVLPCHATYSASKVFVDHFAKCLAFENPDKIDVLVYKPNLVESNLVRRKPSFGILSSKEAASSALDKMGWDLETEGHWRHVVVNGRLKLMRALLPEKMNMRLINQQLRPIAKIVKAENRNRP